MERGGAVASSKAKDKLAPRDADIFKLNDDCLAEVFSYLTLTEVTKIIQSDERFRPAAKIRFGRGIDIIDPVFLTAYPKDIQDDIYQAYGKRAKKIEFKILPEMDFLPAIAHFESLSELVLREMNLTTDHKGHKLPNGLTSLEIDCCLIHKDFLRKWCAKLNGTLKELKIKHRYRFVFDHERKTFSYAGLKELQNLSSLSIDGELDDSLVAALIGQHKDLRSLTITNRDAVLGIGTLTEAIWENIAKLKRLNKLHLDHSYYETAGIPSNLFPELTHLFVKARRLNFIINGLACESTLDTLIIDEGTSQGFDPPDLIRFKNLRHFKIVGELWGDGGHLPQMFALNQLHTLNLDGGYFGQVADIVQLVQSMPNLKKISLLDISFQNEERGMPKRYVEDQIWVASTERANPLEFDVSLRSPYDEDDDYGCGCDCDGCSDDNGPISSWDMAEYL